MVTTVSSRILFRLAHMFDPGPGHAGKFQIALTQQGISTEFLRYVLKKHLRTIKNIM